MDNQDFFNLMKTPAGPSAVVLSSDSSWTFNSDSDTSLPISRGAVDVVEICPSVAVKICSAGKTTDTIAKDVNPQPDSKPINAHVISPTVTDEQATDEQSTDEQDTDEHAPTVAPQQVRSSQELLSFNNLYCMDGKDVCAKPQSSDSSSVAYKRHMTIRVDVAGQVDIMNLQQGHTSSPGGDAGNLQTSVGIRSGITAKARNMNFQSGDMKRRIRGASISSIDTESRELSANRCKPIVAKNLMINTDKRIIKVYMNQSNKVSTKPAPFLQRSSSYINRQVTQRETDRKNYMMVKKLISVKAEVSSFR